MMMEDDGGVTEAERVYAKFSSLVARKSSSITLSNNDLTAALNTSVHNNVYLDIDKTSGKWACEFTNLAAFTGSRVSSFGFGTLNGSDGSFQLFTKFGGFQFGVGYQPFDGSRNVNIGSPVVTTNYWRTISTINTVHIVIFDFDNKQLLCPNPANTALISSSIGSITANLFAGLSMYGTATSTTLNSGQTAFTAGNEALIAAYETANGVTINRGLWA